MRDPQPTGVYATDVAGARMLGVLADILDTPHESPLPSLSMRALRAIDQLREWGIHPGQRDADGLPVPPPHDDDCQVCGGAR